MADNIVDVVVTQLVAPTPQTLQSSGAFVSQGATTLAPNSSRILTQLSDLTPLLHGALALTTLSWSGGTITATTGSAHGLPVSEFVDLTIAGCTPTAYNGTYHCFISDTTHFTYPVPTNPGIIVTPGSWTEDDVAELLAMATTFFAQGSSQAVSVLELGVGSDDDGIAALSAYITSNPNSNYRPGLTGFFYIHLVPRSWAGNTNYLSLVAQYEGTTAKTYFFTTTSLANYGLFTALMKSALTLTEDPQSSQYAANRLTALSWSNSTGQGLITATTTTPHGVNVGDWFELQGSVPTAYNGWYRAALGTTGSTLVASKATNPGSQTTLGTLQGSQVTSAGVPATEFSLAAVMWKALSQNPSPTNRMTPFAFSFMFGVTPFKRQGRGSLLAALKAASNGYVDTGGEGGISTAMLKWGMTQDGRDFSYWYSVDWAAINADEDIANAVINGSNNPVNPLYYSQNGIDRIQDVIAARMNGAVTNGLANGTVIKTSLNGIDLTTNLENGLYNGKIVVNAVPFVPYLQANPGHYKIGEYDGFAVIYVPNRGFIHIIFNLVVSDFAVV